MSMPTVRQASSTSVPGVTLSSTSLILIVGLGPLQAFQNGAWGAAGKGGWLSPFRWHQPREGVRSPGNPPDPARPGPLWRGSHSRRGQAFMDLPITTGPAPESNPDIQPFRKALQHGKIKGSGGG